MPKLRVRPRAPPPQTKTPEPAGERAEVLTGQNGRRLFPDVLANVVGTPATSGYAAFNGRTIISRGQLARMCFGVADSHDATFGPSEMQQERNARPERWQNSQPGMCYADLPSVPDDGKAMPLRTWFWGESDKLITDHASRWPAEHRPLDPITAAAMGGRDAPDGHAVITGDDDQGHDDDGAALVRHFAPVEEPGDDEEPPEDIDVPDSEFGRWQFGTPPGVKADPSAARQDLADLIAGWRGDGHKSFVIADLAEFREAVGLSRGWLYKALGEMEDQALIEKADAAAMWDIAA